MSSNEIEPDQAILNAVNGGLILVDRNQRVIRWNSWMRSASGYGLPQVRGKLLAEIFPDADLRRLTTAIAAALTANASTIVRHALNPVILPLQTRSNRPLLHDITVTPVGEDEINGCLVSVTDVTMVTKRERFLRDRQNARYDAVVTTAPDVIITVDEDGLIQFANPAAVTQFGYFSSELIGIDSARLFVTTDDWNAVWRNAIRGTKPRPRWRA